MSKSVRVMIRQRAHRRCEYCHLPDFAIPLSLFHLEHIIAQQHGGRTTQDNLCWSCHRCNFNKGPNLSSVDPLTFQVVRLFNPRTQNWDRHFRWNEAQIHGITKTGRATVQLLDFNEFQRVKLRQTLMEVNEWVKDK